MKKIYFMGLLIGILLSNYNFFAQSMLANDSTVQVPKAISDKLTKYNFSFNKINEQSRLQKSNTYVKFLADTVYTINGNYQFRYTYSYDAKGKIVLELHSLLNNGQYENYTSVKYAYNDNLTSDTVTTSFWENNKWRPDNREFRDYYPNGGFSKMQYEYWDDKWVPESRITQSITNNKNVVLVDFFYDGIWKSEFGMTFISTNNQKVRYQINEEFNDTSQNKLYKYEDFTFPDSTVTILQIQNQDKWVNESKTKVVFDLIGRSKTTYNYIAIGEKWSLIKKEYNTQLENGALASITENWSNGYITSATRNYTIKNSLNDESVYLTEKNKGTGWINDKQITSWYDKNNNLIAQKRRNWNNSQWVPSIVTTNIINASMFISGSDFTIIYKQIEAFEEIKSSTLPTHFSLSQNFPNPFNPITTITYNVPSMEYVTLKVYDVLGNEISTLVNRVHDVGSYSVVFDASKYSSGIYIYRLQAGKFLETKKLLLVK